MSIIRVGLNDTKGYAEGYDAIFKKGKTAKTPAAKKPDPAAKKAAKPAANNTAPAAKKSAKTSAKKK